MIFPRCGNAPVRTHTDDSCTVRLQHLGAHLKLFCVASKRGQAHGGRSPANEWLRCVGPVRRGIRRTVESQTAPRQAMSVQRTLPRGNFRLSRRARCPQVLAAEAGRTCSLG